VKSNDMHCANQIGLCVLCFVVAPRLKVTATAWNTKTFSSRISIATKSTMDLKNIEAEHVEDVDDVTDEDLLRRMNYFQTSFPRLGRFRIVHAFAAIFVQGSGVYALMKLTLIFSTSDSGARWALVLLTIAVNWVQWSWVSQYLRECDDAAVEACRIKVLESSRSPVDEDTWDSDVKIPLLSAEMTSIQEDGDHTSFVFSGKSHADIVSARRLKRKLEEARKKRKDEKERKVNAKRAAANMLRILSLSTPDVGLLSTGFVALVLAALSSALIPRFTGAVVDKVVHSGGDKRGFHEEITWLLLAGLGSGVFGGLRGGILLVALARMKVMLCLSGPACLFCFVGCCPRTQHTNQNVRLLSGSSSGHAIFRNHSARNRIL
jgi:hypothetical protein